MEVNSYSHSRADSAVASAAVAYAVEMLEHYAVMVHATVAAVVAALRQRGNYSVVLAAAAGGNSATVEGPYSVSSGGLQFDGMQASRFEEPFRSLETGFCKELLVQDWGQDLVDVVGVDL